MSATTSRTARHSASRSPTARRWPSRSPTWPSSWMGCAWPRTGPPPASTRGCRLRARWRWPGGCPPTGPWRSARTASSCSAATATSRSTRWSAGTATCGQRGSWKELCWSSAPSIDHATLMINLETPTKFQRLISQAHQVAAEVLRPNSRRYDTLEHEYPKELDMLAAAIDGLNAGGALGGAGAGAVGSNGSSPKKNDDGGNRNGSNMASLLGLIEMCWGDVGLLLRVPRPGVGGGG